MSSPMNSPPLRAKETGSPLTYSLDQGGYPKGEYHVGYYVDGELADEITFELK